MLYLLSQVNCPRLNSSHNLSYALLHPRNSAGLLDVYTICRSLAFPNYCR
jgi:hypothetical protein